MLQLNLPRTVGFSRPLSRGRACVLTLALGAALSVAVCAQAPAAPAASAAVPSPAPAVAAPAETQKRAEFEARLAQLKTQLDAEVQKAEQAMLAARQKVQDVEAEMARLKADMVKAGLREPELAPAPGQPAGSMTVRPRADGETLVTQPWGAGKMSHEPPELIEGKKIEAAPAITAGEAAAGGLKQDQKLQFVATMVSGDRDIVEKLAIWKEWSGRITFNPTTLREINEFRTTLTKALQEEGYVFAKVNFPVKIWAYGMFLAQVDCGPLGDVTVRGNRHYSADQIIRAVSHEATDRFNYVRVYQDIFALTTKPDLEVDTNLTTVQKDGRTVVNAELSVKDSLPLHGAVELTNTGNEETGEWRTRTTLQHLNLTRHDDVLTLGWLTNPKDVGDISAYSASYNLPFWEKYSLSFFGGYSASSITDVMPELSANGRGTFFGSTFSLILKETKSYSVDLSAGWLYQSSTNATDIAGVNFGDDEVALSMFRFTLGYADKVFDRFGGRNFLSYSKIVNSEGRYGGSDQEDFTNFQQNADAGFMIDELKLARFQRMTALGDNLLGRSMLFMKANGRYTGDNLVSPVQSWMGGMDTVRGYNENVVSGDSSVNGTLELRLPVFSNFIPGMIRKDKAPGRTAGEWTDHGLQFIVFTDAAWVGWNEPAPGVDRNNVLASGGAGFRLSLTPYFQVMLDYGVSFTDIEDASTDSGRAHLSLKLQF